MTKKKKQFNTPISRIRQKKHISEVDSLESRKETNVGDTFRKAFLFQDFVSRVDSSVMKETHPRERFTDIQVSQTQWQVVIDNSHERREIHGFLKEFFRQKTNQQKEAMKRDKNSRRRRTKELLSIQIDWKCVVTLFPRLVCAFQVVATQKNKETFSQSLSVFFWSYRELLFDRPDKTFEEKSKKGL